MNQYEAMFLFDASFASEMDKAREEINRILDRAEAELVFCEKWDERKLAYEIKGRKRGCYVLTYFRSQPSKIVGIERDASLSELVLRLLVRRAEQVTREQMDKNLPNARAADTEQGNDSERPRESRATTPESEPSTREAVAVGETKTTQDD